MPFAVSSLTEVEASQLVYRQEQSSRCRSNGIHYTQTGPGFMSRSSDPPTGRITPHRPRNWRWTAVDSFILRRQERLHQYANSNRTGSNHGPQYERQQTPPPPTHPRIITYPPHKTRTHPHRNTNTPTNPSTILRFIAENRPKLRMDSHGPQIHTTSHNWPTRFKKG